MIWIIVSSILILALLILLIVYYFGAGLGELKKGEKEFKLDGFSEGFVPQGIAFDRANNKFLISGYMSGNSGSRVYVVDKQTSVVEKFVVFENLNKTKFIGHAGGIAVYNGFGFISSECLILRFSLSKLYDAKLGETVMFDYEFKTGTGADFCFVQNGLLWVGEYYKTGKYKTEVTHHILFGENKRHSAVAFAFRLSERGMLGSFPEKAFSLPDMVQGMEFYGGRYFLSISYGLNKSKLLEYDNILLKPTKRNMIFNNKSVPLWIFEDKFLRKTRILPPMSEGIVQVNGRLYVVFESASKKYKYFMRNRLKNVYSLKID